MIMSEKKLRRTKLTSNIKDVAQDDHKKVKNKKNETF